MTKLVIQKEMMSAAFNKRLGYIVLPTQVPDLNNYPMFSVKCLEATESLAKKADALHTQVKKCW